MRPLNLAHAVDVRVSVGDEDDTHGPIGCQDALDQAAGGQRFVVRVRREDEQSQVRNDLELFLRSIAVGRRTSAGECVPARGAGCFEVRSHDCTVDRGRRQAVTRRQTRRPRPASITTVNDPTAQHAPRPQGPVVPFIPAPSI